MSYIIIKMVKDTNREKELPVILLDGENEILEFDIPAYDNLFDELP